MSSQVLEEFNVEGKCEVFPAVFVYGLSNDTVCLCTVAGKPYSVCWSSSFAHKAILFFLFFFFLLFLRRNN